MEGAVASRASLILLWTCGVCLRLTVLAVPPVIALIQRVTEGSVRIDGRIVGQIGPGLLALIGVVSGDDTARAERLLQRLLEYRVFADAAVQLNGPIDRAGDMDHDYNQKDVSQNPMAVFKQFVDRPIMIGVDRRK